MGTGRATTALTDGQIVTVDGDRGRGDAADVDGGVRDAQPTADESHDETRAMYDRIAGIYQVVEGAWERAAIMRGVALLDARPGESVLEVGCGPGAALVRLARAVQPGGRAVGIDLSPRMCRIARQRIRRAHLTTVASVGTCDATRLPFPAGSFDACFMSFTLELFATPEIPTVLAEIARVLRAGGRIGVVASPRTARTAADAACTSGVTTSCPDCSTVDPSTCRPSSRGPASRPQRPNACPCGACPSMRSSRPTAATSAPRQQASRHGTPDTSRGRAS